MSMIFNLPLFNENYFSVSFVSVFACAKVISYFELTKCFLKKF